MTLIQSFILAFTQGITEFLPISSKGHLNLVSHFLGLTPTLSLDIFLNTATLISVIFYFRHQLSYFFKNLKYIFVGTIPAVVIGFLFKHNFESIVGNLSIYPFFFLLTSVALFSTHFFPKKENRLTYTRALIIGFIQSLALFPGVSRSGSTIFAGLLVGLSPLESFNFSFCLFIPASLGALILDLKDASLSSFAHPIYLFTFAVTAIVGVAAINLLQKTLISRRFWLFGIYTFILAVGLFLVFR